MMGFLDNLEAYLDYMENKDKEPETESGYFPSIWLDDEDYKGNIVPFFGKNI